MTDFVEVWQIEHKLYRKLAWDPKIRDPATSVEDFLLRIEEIAQSCVVGTGGWLLEAFILRYGSQEDALFLSRQIRNNFKLDADERKSMIVPYSLKFWFHVVRSIHHVNKFASEPLQMFSLVLEYHGLSRQGAQILALCGAAMIPRTTDRKKKRKLDEYDEENNSLTIEGKVVISFDNFNHSWGSAAMRLNKKTYMINMNVTVAGLSVMHNPMDQSFVIVNRRALHSVPSTKAILVRYIDSLMTKLKKVQQDLIDMTGKPFDFFSIARCVKEEIETVPITSIETMSVDEGEEDHFNLESYRPAFVSIRDTTENKGVAHLMSRIFNMCSNVLRQRKYVYVKMDAAVYKKWLRVCFN
jgi:hypothetical protein